MNKVKVIKVKQADFEGDDGKQVTGQYVYVVPVEGNDEPRRLFLSDARLLDLDHVPVVGDEVYLFASSMGRIVDIVKA